MKTTHRNTFTTIRTEGAILPPDLLQRVSDPSTGSGSSLEGLQPGDYHLFEGEKLNEAINRSWNRLIGAWEKFKQAKEKVFEGQPGTTETRQRWLLPLFQELGYGRLQTSTAFNIEGKSYPISHGWERAPIHLLGFNIDLGKRTPGVAGAATTSPHSMVQEFLNRSDDHLWAFLSNGLQLRVLRDNVSLTRQAYVEFDLEAMMEGEVYADFVLLWLLCHQSRVEGEKPEEFWLEQWSRQAQEQGMRALDQLRKGVEEAISSLGSGFLRASNPKLRANLRSGTLSPQDYYRQLLRMVYRLIFLFVAEDRNLLFPPKSDPLARERYRDYYSTQRLRRLAERSRGLRHDDLYYVLRLVTEKLSSMAGSPELALPALGGFLFSADATPDLDVAELPNQNLLDAVRALAYTVDGRTLRPVDYKNLGPEELGSVYESLLELHPEMNVDAGTFNLTSASGHERKTTGSYYTPSSLIQVLLDSALDPVIERVISEQSSVGRSQVTDDCSLKTEQALLAIKVCDPAVGSGHFLIAAAHRLARHLAGIRTGDDEPSPDATRAALRDVIGNCLYGVDLNPMAVELCKVSLWMEALEPGKPLSFLDAHIKCGNSLVGVGPNLDISEIPDDAFKPAFGDDKKTATALRKRNRRERKGQLGFRWDVTHIQSQEDLAQWVTSQSRKMEMMPEDAAVQVQAKALAYQSLISDSQYLNQRLEYDLWTAAFFWPIPKKDAERMLAPTQQELIQIRAGQELDLELFRWVQELSQTQRFFHWAIEFPMVFEDENNGFDIIVGNPPWERTSFEEKEFFASRNRDIVLSSTTASRKEKIENLKTDNPILYQEYNASKHSSEAENIFLKSSGRYKYSASGRINTYALFTELAIKSISLKGRVGIIVQTGIATDVPMEKFWRFLMDERRLVSLIDFENKKPIFFGVHREQKFCLLSMTGSSREMQSKVKLGFWLTDTKQLADNNLVFNISLEELIVINPLTKQPPVCRRLSDFSLVSLIHKNNEIMSSKSMSGDIYAKAWVGLISASYSKFYKTEYDLEGSYSNDLGGVAFSNHRYLPLLEGKLIHQFDYKYATYDGVTINNIKKGNPTIVNASNKNIDRPKPRYWIDKEITNKFYETKGFTDDWVIGIRDVTNVNNERTAIACLLPKVGLLQPLNGVTVKGSKRTLFILGAINSLALDYVAKQKIPGRHLNVTIFSQLPYPRRRIISLEKLVYAITFELSYTSIDLKGFANFVGFSGPPFPWDAKRRFLIRCELDASFFHLYGIRRENVKFMLDTFTSVKKKDFEHFGEYKTMNLILQYYDDMAKALNNNSEYVSNNQPMLNL
jgi:hypothetical protein